MKFDNTKRSKYMESFISLEGEEDEDISKWMFDNKFNVHRFWKVSTNSLEEYYGPPGHMRYGLFCPIIDRFLVLDCYDLEAVTLTARLLSSKATTYICMFGGNVGRLQMTNLDCHLWTVAAKTYDYAAYQSPAVFLAGEASDLEKQGWPIDYQDRKEQVLELMMYARFCLRTAYAALLTDKLTNRYLHDFYYALAKNDIDKIANGTGHPNKFALKPDMSGTEDGWVTTISRVLYYNTNIDDVIEELAKILFRGGLLKQRQIYEQFRYFLYESGANLISEQIARFDKITIQDRSKLKLYSNARMREEFQNYKRNKGEE